VQQPAVLPRTRSQAGLPADEKTPVLQGDANGCDHLRDGRIPPQGLEPGDVTPSVPEDLRQTLNQRAAECAAVGDDLPPINPDLSSVIEAWDSLPPDTRTAILAIVEAAQGR